MIISCEKCNKKFELNTNLIPNTGRLLQCGSCSHQWYYRPQKNLVSPKQSVDNNEEEINDLNNSLEIVNKKIEDKIPEKEKEIKPKENKKNLRKTGFLNILIVLVISFVAVILVVETFKSEISILIPNIDFYLYSLYESAKDIYLFFKDLIK